MGFKLKEKIKSLFSIEPKERTKVLLLAITLFLIIGSYTITKELKDVVFANVVGLNYQPYAKIISMIILVPAIFFYSRLVDILRRHQLLYFYIGLYGVLGLLFTYLLGHPEIGLVNSNASPYRLFGWGFYFFIEGFSPFIIGVTWAFINSVSSANAARTSYPIIIAGSKLGGGLTSLLAIVFLSLSNRIYDIDKFDVFNHQVLLASASLLLLSVPIIIHILIKVVPKKDLHGYEASYQEAKHRLKDDDGKPKPKESFFKSIFSGAWLLIKYPYVSGIFFIGFFYELINQVFNFARLIFGKQQAVNISSLTIFLLKQAFIVHLIGLIVVLFGTRPILKALGEKRSLVLVPILAGLSVLYYLVFPSEGAAIAAFVIIRAVNYAFASPLRESLYIPTIKEIQFKSKSWIDGFGSKIAKSSAATFNKYVYSLSPLSQLSAQSVFFGIVIVLWVAVAYLLGRKFEYVVKNNKVIGKSSNE